MPKESDEQAIEAICAEFYRDCKDELDERCPDYRYLGQYLEIALINEGYRFEQLNRDCIEHFLSKLLPRQLLVTAENAETIVTELCIFFKYATDKYQLTAGPEIVAHLQIPRTVQHLQQALSDKTQFGPAKAIAMSAMELGYDITNPEEMNDFVSVYNKSVSRQPPTPDPESNDSQSFARVDNKHAVAPPATSASSLSPEERKKCNKDRRKALARKKQK